MSAARPIGFPSPTPERRPSGAPITITAAQRAELEQTIADVRAERAGGVLLRTAEDIERFIRSGECPGSST